MAKHSSRILPRRGVLACWFLAHVARTPSNEAAGACQREAAAMCAKRNAAPAERPSRSRRLVLGLVFTVLFFAGATVSASAGDILVDAAENSTTVATEETVTSETEASEAPVEPAPEPIPAPPDEPPASEPAPSSETPVPTPEPVPAPAPAPAAEPAPVPEPAPVRAAADPARAPETLRPPELEGPSGSATIWLHRALPDPTPPAKRLSPAFARSLSEAARRAGVDWALVLAVLRAQGHDGPVPAGADRLSKLATRLARLDAAGARWAAFTLSGRAAFAGRVAALVRYNHAVGLRALVTGLRAAKPRLVVQVLRDERIDVYAGGRADLVSGRVDVRILVLLRYLALTHGQVSVSSLRTGHGLYARPGVVSAHVYGLAVDISAVGGLPVAGNQQPGGVTERAVQAILLLPRELQPQQVISLLGLGGPSFPLADHADHIHVGYS